jgi:hypothetical protein
MVEIRMKLSSLFLACFFLDLRVCPNPVVGYFNRVNKNRQHPFVSFIELAGKMQ